jgi:hypothetical protein
MQKTKEAVADIISLEKKLYGIENPNKFETLLGLFRRNVDPSYEYSKKINEKKSGKKEEIIRKLKELFSSIKDSEENLILYINLSDAEIIKKLYNIDPEYTKFEFTISSSLPLFSDLMPPLLPSYRIEYLIYPKSPKNVDLAKQLVEKIIASLEEKSSNFKK